MNKLRNYLLLTAFGFAILVGTLLFTGSPPINAANKQDVRVINTTSEPVPTAAQGTTAIVGTVNVGNTPTVNLASGSSVGLDPSNNTVQLGNTMANPVPVRDVDNPARQPFQKGTFYFLNDGESSKGTTLFFVPFGKRLVIEQVSTFAAGAEVGQVLTDV